MIYNKLYEYQKKIVDSQDEPSSALFMDMGTGKTITSLALFEKSKATKVLVICLVSKTSDWVEEIKEQCDIDALLLRLGTVRNRIAIETNPNTEAIVVNFESVWRLENTLMQIINDDWYIIIDESHKIKNPMSKIGRYIKKLTPRTKYKCILSGTPQNQGYIDYYNQLHFIDAMTMSFKEFKKEYCIFDTQQFNGRYVNVLVSYKNTEFFDKLLQEKCVYFKRDVADELIPSHINVKIEKHKSVNKFIVDRVYDDIIADNIPALRMGIRQLCSGFIKQYEVSSFKITWLEEFIESYDKRIVVFYNFNMEGDAIARICKRLKRPYSFYNGASKDLDNFNRNDNGIAICNFGSASLGINDLVKASTCVMYSPTEDYILFEQAKKRIDRIGQNEKPLIYYLKTEKSIEVAIYKSLAEGKNFDDKMFDNYLQQLNI